MFTMRNELLILDLGLGLWWNFFAMIFGNCLTLPTRERLIMEMPCAAHVHLMRTYKPLT